MTDLLDKLKHASEGGKALSDAVGNFMGAPKRYAHPGAEEPSHRNYTTNLQDTVSLALESGATSISLQWRKGELAKALIGFPWDDGVPFAGSGYTLPLAASEAIIKASSKAEAA